MNDETAEPVEKKPEERKRKESELEQVAERCR
jgi:hypothetical protein